LGFQGILKAGGVV